MATDYDKFKRMSFEVLAHSGNCAESRADFQAASSVPEMVQAWKKYWNGLLTEVPYPAVAAISSVYHEYKDEMNKAGLYLNEGRDDGMILVSNCKEELHFGGRANVYVIGMATIHATDHASVYCRERLSKIFLHDYATANIIAGHLELHDRSFAVACCHTTCFDASEVHQMGGKLFDYGHRIIEAHNEALIYSDNKKNISLYEKASILPLNPNKDKQ